MLALIAASLLLSASDRDEAVEAGLPSPRGGDYRRVKIEVGTIWGYPRQIETYAWVMPDRTAICWNGLPYSPIDVGEQGDYRSHTGQATAVIGDTHPLRLGDSEEASLRPSGSVAAALMLLLGDRESAEKCGSIVNLKVQYGWTRYDRALNVFMRGLDKQALEDARLAQRLFRESSFPQNSESVLERLLPDLEGRLANPVPYLSDQQLAALPKSRRLEHLARRLGEAQNGHGEMPAAVSKFDRTPIIHGLLKEGRDGLDILWKELEKPARYTRSVSFQRNFFSHRDLVPVSSMLEPVLVDNTLLRSQLYSPMDGSRGFYLSARKGKGFWDATKRVPEAERWLYVLKSESARPDQWVEAASLLAGRFRIGEQHYLALGPESERRREQEAYSRLKKERHLEITTLMARRVEQLFAAEDLVSATRLASTLRRWSNRVGSKLLDKCLSSLLGKGRLSYGEASIALRLLFDEIQGGDHTAWNRVRRIYKQVEVVDSPYLLWPLILESKSQRALEIADELLADGGKWSIKSMLCSNDVVFELPGTLEPLFALEPGRKHALRLLQDEAPIGVIHFDKKKRAMSYLSAPLTEPAIEANLRHPGDRVTRLLTVRELAAIRLGRVQGFPKYAPKPEGVDEDSLTAVARHMQTASFEPELNSYWPRPWKDRWEGSFLNIGTR